jgi:hypothetical protein
VDTQQETRTSYTGWLRENGGRWRPVAEGATHGEALARLLEVRSVAALTDRLVTETGQDPNARKRRAR